MKFSLSVFLSAVISVSAQDYAGNYLLVNRPSIGLRAGPPPPEWSQLTNWTFLWADCQTSPGALMELNYTFDLAAWHSTPSELMRTNHVSLPVAAIAPDGTCINLLTKAAPPPAYRSGAIAKSFSAGVPMPGPSPPMFVLPKLIPPATTTPLLLKRDLREIVVDLTRGDMIDLQRELRYGEPKYASTKVETQAWSGTIVASNRMRLDVHSDDCTSVIIDNEPELDEFGYPSSWEDLEGSVDLVAILPDGSHEILVKYGNADAGGQPDGLSFIITCTANAAEARPSGPSQIWWYGSPYTNVWTYTLSTFCSSLTWASSSNLTIASSNDTLQTVSVKPNRASESYSSDWIMARYRLPSSSYVTSYFAVTIHYPTTLNPVGYTQGNGGGLYTYRIDYQLLDQFGQNWGEAGYITCSEQDNGGTPSSGTIGGFPTNRVVNAQGRTFDTWRWNTPVGTVDFSRIRERLIHQNPGERGRSLLKTFYYHHDPLYLGRIQDHP